MHKPSNMLKEPVAMIDNNTKLPLLMPDSFANWDNVSVARAITYTNVVQIAQHLNSRDNYDPELSPEEIDKFQKYLYEDCLSSAERAKLPFYEFIGKNNKAKNE